MQHISTTPTRLDYHERRVTTQLVKKVIKTVTAGQIFGFEEIVTCRQIRVIRAKVIKTALLYACSKKHLLQAMNGKDVRQLIEQCRQYTNFD